MIRKEFILSELKYRYPKVTDFIRNPEQTVGRPLLYERREKRFGPRIIVCTAEELNGLNDLDQPAPLFLCAGEPERRVQEALDLCILPGTEHAGAILNFIQRLFDRLDGWRERLRNTAENGEDITALLDEAAGMLQNPIWLCDERCHTVARAERYAAEQRLIDRTVSYKLLEQIKSGGTEASGSTVRFSAEGAPELAFALCEAGGAKFTLVCAASERPFYGSDEAVFEYMIEYVRLMLSERKLSARAARKNIKAEAIERSLAALLRHEGQLREQMTALAEAGWNDAFTYCVVAAETADGDMRKNARNALCDAAEALFADSCAFYATPDVALVVRLPEGSDLNVAAVLGALGEREGFRFGITEPRAGIRDIADRFALAKTTLRLAEASAASASFSDVAEAYLCERGTAEYPARLVCLRSVCEMADYDRLHDTNYIETTERYIKNRFNAVKTANDLFIHRSTLLYRLERIKMQFGLDLESEPVPLMHLLFSLRLVDIPSGPEDVAIPARND